MKRKLLISLYFAFFFLVVRAIGAFVMEEEITNEFIFINSFVAVFIGLFYGFLSNFLFRKTSLPLIKTLVKFPDVELALQEDEEILKEDFGSIKIEKQKEHGLWFLTNARLVFKYNKANNFDKKFEIILNDILKVYNWDAPFFSIYNRGVVIELKSGGKYILINQENEVWNAMLKEKTDLRKSIS